MPALLIGAAAGVVCYVATRLATKLATRWARLDDSFGVVAVHGVGGTFGMLLVGVFAHYTTNPAGLTATNGRHLQGLVFGKPELLGDQVVAVAATIGFTVLCTYLLAVAIRASIGLRASDDQQREGIDTREPPHPAPPEVADKPRVTGVVVATTPGV